MNEMKYRNLDELLAEGSEAFSIERLLAFDASRLREARRRTGKIRKIGVLCGSKAGGGAERATRIWIKNVKRDFGIDVYWLCDDHQNYGTGLHCDDDGIVYRPIPVGSPGMNDVTKVRLRASSLRTVIESEGIDTILLADHSIWRVYADAAVAEARGCRVIMADHSAYFYAMEDCNPVLYKLRETFYPTFDAVTALSPANVAWWRSTGLRNVVYMPNFLTFDPNAVRPQDARDNPTGFVSIGRMCALKGTDKIIRAYAEYANAHAGEVDGLTFCGRFETEEYERKIRELVSACDVGDRVAFVGEIDNVQDYLSKSKALVMASRIEGAPMVLMEAKSFGVPTVMFELPFVVSTTPADGVLSVPYGDIAGLARAMETISTDEKARVRLGEAARRSLGEFDRTRILSRWRSLFEQIESGAQEIAPGCDLPSDETMFAMTMRSCASFAGVLAERQVRLLKTPGKFPYPVWITGEGAFKSTFLSLAPYGLTRKWLAERKIEIEFPMPDKRLSVRVRRFVKKSAPYVLVMAARKLFDRA